MDSKESVKIMHFNRKQKMEKKMSIENLTAYEIVEDREIKDLNSRGVILRHKKTGARIVLLSNDDPNKVFYIGFRTPPIRQHGCATYHGTQCTLRFREVSGQGSVCGTGKGFPEHFFKCHDLPG